MDKIIPHLKDLPDLRQFVVWDKGANGPNIISIDELMRKGEDALQAARNLSRKLKSKFNVLWMKSTAIRPILKPSKNL